MKDAPSEMEGLGLEGQESDRVDQWGDRCICPCERPWSLAPSQGRQQWQIGDTFEVELDGKYTLALELDRHW